MKYLSSPSNNKGKKNKNENYLNYIYDECTLGISVHIVLFGSKAATSSGNSVEKMLLFSFRFTYYYVASDTYIHGWFFEFFYVNL